MRCRGQYGATKLGPAGCSWFPGEITRVHADGSLNIKYDDGDCEKHVKSMYVKPLLRHQRGLDVDELIFKRCAVEQVGNEGAISQDELEQLQQLVQSRFSGSKQDVAFHTVRELHLNEPWSSQWPADAPVAPRERGRR